MLIKPGTKVSLKQYDPDDTGDFKSEDEAEVVLQKYLQQLGKLQQLLYAENRRALLIVLQGMDTSGKDGTIRKVMSGLTPLGVQVKAFKAPHEEELAHDFLWRVHQAVPRRGYFGIFNRSHYEDVLIVRVHELVPRKVWKARYEQINQFEKMLVKNDTIVLKFFLHISKGEQRRRLEDRLNDPTRYWKFSLNDVEERQHWSAYQKAYEAALTRCSTRWAPWHIVPANNKWYRNVVVAQVMVETLRALDMKYPEPTIDLSKVVIE
ncbi:MAG: polyphosphate kinase 2 family protein [Gemmataceae bacterium]|nr:polyphosphate kinase 2 family protein [Gemmataceae bacterium]